MPLPLRVRPETDPCLVMGRFGTSYELSQRLVSMSASLEFPISVISGLRTPRQQQELRDSGRPAAPDDQSTHLSCPATGVDLRVGVAVTDVVKARLGTEGTRAGLRWGGGSPVDRSGIPSDWNHFDLGPRRA